MKIPVKCLTATGKYTVVYIQLTRELAVFNISNQPDSQLPLISTWQLLNTSQPFEIWMQSVPCLCHQLRRHLHNNSWFNFIKHVTSHEQAQKPPRKWCKNQVDVYHNHHRSLAPVFHAAHRLNVFLNNGKLHSMQPSWPDGQLYIFTQHLYQASLHTVHFPSQISGP